jgi:hypothetical protein
VALTLLNLQQPEPRRAAAPSLPPQTRAPRERAPRLPVSGGRVSLDDPTQIFYGGLQVLARLSGDEEWRALALDSKTLDRLPARRLWELLLRLSPEISRAWSDFLLFCAKEVTVKVRRKNSEQEFPQAQAVLDDFFELLQSKPGAQPFAVVVNQMFTAAFVRGEIVVELVLDDARQMSNLFAPDPSVFDYRRELHPVDGQIWRFGQWQEANFVDLDTAPGLRYCSINPLPGKPHGTSMIEPALFSALFLIGILHDLRRVISQQGWPRLHIQVLTEKLQALMQDFEESDSEKQQEAINKAINDVATYYSQLEPDDAYVSTDAIKIDRGIGNVDPSSLGGIEQIIAILERMMVRALKTMPLLLGLTESTSEANANRQWEIFTARIGSVQGYVAQLLKSLFEFGLRAQGILANVVIEFGNLRVSDRLRQAQAEKLEIQNEREKFNAGWTSQDEAANVITGHDADAPEPRQAMTSTGGGIGGNPDPGANRQVQRAGQRSPESLSLLMTAEALPSEAEIEEAERLWRAHAPAGAADLFDAELMN